VGSASCVVSTTDWVGSSDQPRMCGFSQLCGINHRLGGGLAVNDVCVGSASYVISTTDWMGSIDSPHMCGFSQLCGINRRLGEV